LEFERDVSRNANELEKKDGHRPAPSEQPGEVG